MVLTVVQQDKFLQNSVDTYYVLHQKHCQRLKEENLFLKQEKDYLRSLDKVGRHCKLTQKIPKSTPKDISLNTAAFKRQDP